MKYQDILQFDPITEVIQLDLLDKEDYRKGVVKICSILLKCKIRETNERN